MRTRRKRTALYVSFSEVNLSPFGLPDAPESWVVSVDDPESDKCCLLWGFARKRDAEIAMQFLASLPVDWFAPSLPMWRQCAEAGYADRESLMRAALERLPW